MLIKLKATTGFTIAVNADEIVMIAPTKLVANTGVLLKNGLNLEIDATVDEIYALVEG